MVKMLRFNSFLDLFNVSIVINYISISEFENAETLLISEVQMLLEHR